MPDKFYVSDAGGSNKKSPLLMIMIVVLVLIIIGGVGFFMYQRMNNTTPEDTNQLVANLNTQPNPTNQPLNTNTNSTNNTNRLTNGNANTNGVISLNSNINTNSVFQNTNTSANVNAITVTSSEDADNDGLTNVEEALYGTSLTVADTDGDSFADGQEVLNGYDPNAAGKALTLNPAIKSYTNATDGYSIFYPSSWDVSNDPQNARGKLFSTSGEFVSVSLQDNPGQLSARDWYLSKAPGIDFTAITSVTTWDGTLSGVKSVDGTTVYLTRGTAVYVISYNTNILSEANYLTTFQMMYQSMGLVSANSNSNTNTATNTSVNTNTNTNQNTNTNSNSNANTNRL